MNGCLRYIVSLPALVAAVCLFGAGPAFPAADVENCALCHKYPGLGRIDEKGKKHSYYVNETDFTHSVHGRVRCTGCHLNVEKFPHDSLEEVNCATECHIVEPSTESKFSHKKVIDVFQSSVHGTYEDGELKEHAEDLPDCIYCHTNRITKPLLLSPSRPDCIAKDVIDRCLGCHDDDRWTRTYYSHVTHRMKRRRSAYDTVELCASCHEDEQKMSRHGLEATGTYRDTFHWQAIKYGDPNAPNCIDCHAPVGHLSHDIVTKTDPRSAVYPENRVQTCANPFGLQKCHPDATDAFAAGKIHPSGVKADLFDTKLATFEMKKKIQEGKIQPFKTIMQRRAQEDMTTMEYYQYLIIQIITYFYKLLIGGLISFMIIHQLLDFFATRREMKQTGRKH